MKSMNKQPDFLIRTRKYCNYKKMTVHAFELSNGFSNSWATNLKAQIRLDAVERIVRNYPDLNITWLLTGIGTMLNLPSDIQSIRLLEAKDETIRAQKETIESYEKIIRALTRPEGK